MGGTGNDTLTGNGGIDQLTAGDGDDVVNARDGVVDRVDCGGGNDTVIADVADVVVGVRVECSSRHRHHRLHRQDQGSGLRDAAGQGEVQVQVADGGCDVPVQAGQEEVEELLVPYS